MGYSSAKVATAASCGHMAAASSSRLGDFGPLPQEKAPSLAVGLLKSENSMRDLRGSVEPSDSGS